MAWLLMRNDAYPPSSFSPLALTFSGRRRTVAGMSFEIASTRRFCAAHSLKLYDGSMEPIHGHNWRVQVRVSSPKLDSIGVVMDFHLLEKLIDDIVTPWHNRHLNECPPFATELNPTAENVAFHVGRSLKLPDHVTLLSVEVWETDENSAVYRPNG